MHIIQMLNLDIKLYKENSYLVLFGRLVDLLRHNQENQLIHFSKNYLMEI
jgi:hypothetical protein